MQVPVYKENQRLQPSNPTGFQSSGNARLMGETLSGVGKGIADIGLALEQNDRKLKAAKAKTDSMSVKNEAEKWAQSKTEELAMSGGDGSTYLDEYDQSWTKTKDKMLNDLNKRGIGTTMTANELNAIADDMYIGYRKNLQVMAVTQQKDSLKKSVVELTAQFTTQSYEAPERLDETISDYSASLGGAMEAMGKSPRQIQEFNRSGAQQLTRQAISGLTDKGKFEEAKKVALEKGSFFAPEEQRAMLKEINTKKLQARTLFHSEVDRQERQAEADLKLTQTKELNALYAELNDARVQSNPALVASVNKKISQKLREGRLASSAYGSLVSQAGNREKQISAESNFALMGEYYKAKTKDDYAALESKVHSKVASGRLNEKDALGILKLLNTSKTNSPLSKAELGRYKAVEHQLEAILPGPDTIQKLMIKLDQNEAKAYAARVYGIKADIEIGKANGVPASETLTAILFKYFDSLERQSPMPNMPADVYSKVAELRNIPEDKQSTKLMEIKKWGIEKFRGDKINAPSFESWYLQLEDAVRQNNFKRSILNLDQEIGRLKNEDNFSKWSGQNIDELVEQAGNVESDPDTLPMILRNYGE